MKLKKLLPIAAVASTAAIVAPIITACSCATTVKLDYFDEAEATISNKEPITINANKFYCVTINMKDFEFPYDLSELAWALGVWDGNSEEAITYPLNSFSVEIDGTQLTEYKGKDQPGQNQFQYVEEHGSFFLGGHEGDVKKDSVVKIKLKVDADKKDVYFSFTATQG